MHADHPKPDAGHLFEIAESRRAILRHNRPLQQAMQGVPTATIQKRETGSGSIGAFIASDAIPKVKKGN